MRILASALSRAATAALLTAAMAIGAAGVQAQEMNFFTIGTGGTGATYFPLGGAQQQRRDRAQFHAGVVCELADTISREAEVIVTSGGRNL